MAIFPLLGLFVTVIVAVATAVWVLSSQIRGGNESLSKELAMVRTDIAVVQSEARSDRNRIDDVVMPKLADHEHRLRIVEIGESLTALAEALHQHRMSGGR